MPRTHTEKRLRPRKTPRQARAVDTQARILEAARRVFARHGYAAGTTNRIADLAGLSVGSLYQYFPNKDSILAALVREHIAEGARELRAATRDPGADLESLVRRVVTSLVELHARDRRLHRVLFEESPRPASLRAELRGLEESAVALVAARLETALPGRPDPELVARIVVTAIESLVHRLVASDLPLDPARFTDEVTRLVAGYLGPR
jgi:AcrR family transcriptional regulator